MHKKWEDEFNHLLGTMPDNDIARRLNISRWVVVGARYRLGIKAFRDGSPAHQRHQETVKAFSDEELKKPLRLHAPHLTPYIITERRTRGMRIGKAHYKFRVGPDSLKQAMIKAAFDFNPDVTLTEIGECLGITRERVRQLVNKMRRRPTVKHG